MSAENVQRLEAAFAALTAGDMDGALEHLHPEFEVIDHIALEPNPTVRGPGALVENLAYPAEAFATMNWEAREVVDLEDRILVRVVLTATGKHSDLPVETEVGHVYVIEGGKALSLEIFRTWDEALAAGGAGS